MGFDKIFVSWITADCTCFNFEITTGKSGNKSKIKNDYFNEYIDSNLQTLSLYLDITDDDKKKAVSLIA